MQRKILAFVARSGTGKTALVEKLIAELARRGRKVGAIKHTVHEIELDQSGKDSRRLFEAGAEAVVVAAPDRVFGVERRRAEPTLEELAARLPAQCELAIAEGWKRGPSPKIEVHRKACAEGLLCRGEAHDPNLVAVASDEPLALDVPVLPLDDVGAIADFVEAWLRR